MTQERTLYLANKYPKEIFWWLTKDNFAFAKALWGERRHRVPHYGRDGYGLCDNDCDVIGSHEADYCWQAHLQNMVIAPDPIKYLGENMPEEL